MSTAEPVGVGITTEGTNMYKKTESKGGQNLLHTNYGITTSSANSRKSF